MSVVLGVRGKGGDEGEKYFMSVCVRTESQFEIMHGGPGSVDIHTSIVKSYSNNNGGYIVRDGHRREDEVNIRE